MRTADNDGRFHRFDAGRARVADARAPVDGQLWYRTGDVVETQAGELVHIGRLDRQLKVRGYRVEPEEVERALRAHPAVDDAVVAASPGDGASLVAFVVGSAEGDATLHEHLCAVLPRHLVPSRIVWVDRLPTNDRGKVDHHEIAALAAGLR